MQPDMIEAVQLNHLETHQRIHNMSSLSSAVTILTLQLWTMSIILGFTHAGANIRQVALAIIALCPVVQFKYLDGIEHPVLRAFIGAACIFVVVLYTDAVLIHKWEYEAQGPTSGAGGLIPVIPIHKSVASKGGSRGGGWSPAVLPRLEFGIRLSLTSRFPATRWAVKNIPAFSGKDPTYIPSQWVFICTATTKLFLCILLIALLDFMPKSSTEEKTNLFSSQKIPFFTRLVDVSDTEILIRLASVLGYWFVQYLVIQAAYYTLALPSVILGLTESKEWPPVFGSVGDSYSIRNFWG